MSSLGDKKGIVDSYDDIEEVTGEVEKGPKRLRKKIVRSVLKQRKTELRKRNLGLGVRKIDISGSTGEAKKISFDDDFQVNDQDIQGDHGEERDSSETNGCDGVKDAGDDDADDETMPWKK